MISGVRLFKGDCLEIMKSIPTACVDFVLCDLPYGTTSCKWDAVIPFVPLWEQYNRVVKPNAAIVLFGTHPFTSHLILSNVRGFKYWLVWKKSKCGSPLAAKYRPMAKHKDILVFKHTNIGTRYPGSVLDFPQNWRRQDQLHPTQKPVELAEYLIQTYTDAGAIVLDNCMGSGTTGAACVNTHREFIGREKDPKYFQIAKEGIGRSVAQ
jgi:DNA modification methylase